MTPPPFRFLAVFCTVLLTVLEVSSSPLDRSFAFKFVDAQLSVIVPLLITDGAPNVAEANVAEAPVANRHATGNDELPAQLTSEELQAANSILDLVVSQISSRSVLDLGDVYELTEPSAAPLVHVLIRPLPKRGHADKVLTLLRDMRDAFDALLGPAGVAELRKVLPDTKVGKDAGADAVAGAGSLGAPKHSFPLLRRAATARLVQLWLRHREEWAEGGAGESGWAAEVMATMGEVLLQLFLLHRAGMVAREVLEFLHVSKAAGTSMCHLAGEAGCRASDFGMGRTCLLREFDDQPRWLNGSHHWAAIAPLTQPHAAHPTAFLLYGLPRSPTKRRTCPERLKMMRKRRLDFFANEYTVYNELVMTNQTLPAALGSRPPPPPPEDPAVALHRTVSSFQGYVERLTAAGREAAGSPAFSSRSGSSSGGSGGDYSAVIRGTHLCRRFANVAVLRDPSRRLYSHMAFIAQTYVSHFEWPSVADAFAAGRDSAAWWRAFAPPLMDNYLLRTLGGEGTFALPLGHVRREPYMQLAQAVLAQYDVVLVLEFDSERQQRACRYGLGWNHTLAEFQLRTANASTPSSAPHHSRRDPRVVAIEQERARQLLPAEAVLQELTTDAVRYDNELYHFGAVLAGLDDVVWRVAHGVLGEPMPGFWSDPAGRWPGGSPQCGFINGGRGVTPPVS